MVLVWSVRRKVWCDWLEKTSWWFPPQYQCVGVTVLHVADTQAGYINMSSTHKRGSTWICHFSQTDTIRRQCVGLRQPEITTANRTGSVWHQWYQERQGLTWENILMAAGTGGVTVLVALVTVVTVVSGRTLSQPDIDSDQHISRYLHALQVTTHIRHFLLLLCISCLFLMIRATTSFHLRLLRRYALLDFNNVHIENKVEQTILKLIGNKAKLSELMQ